MFLEPETFTFARCALIGHLRPMSLIVKTWIDLRFAFRRAATRDKIMAESEEMIDNARKRVYNIYPA